MSPGLDGNRESHHKQVQCQARPRRVPREPSLVESQGTGERGQPRRSHRGEMLCEKQARRGKNFPKAGKEESSEPRT
jgi:hypothetical protein